MALVSAVQIRGGRALGHAIAIVCRAKNTITIQLQSRLYRCLQYNVSSFSRVKENIQARKDEYSWHGKE